MPSALVHDADIASVAATVLTSDGHSGKDYWLTGPEALTAPERVAILAEALGRDLHFVELSQAEIVAKWQNEGYSASDIEFFIAMRTTPPPAGHTPLPTVEEVTGTPARTSTQWARENTHAF